MDMINNEQDNSNLLYGDIYEELFDSITEQEVRDLKIETEKESFAITNDEQANFFLRRIEELRFEKDKINMMCDKEIEAFNTRVNTYRNEEVRKIDNAENYFSVLLENYARIQLADSKKKSLKLPFGTLSFKKSPDKYTYEDKELMEFIKQNELNQFIRTKEEINKKDLKASLTIKDGQAFYEDKIVEGVSFTPGEQKFSIK